MYFNKTLSVFLLILVATIYVACSPALYQPLPEMATTHASFEELQLGRKFYVNKCGSCHSLYLPQRYTHEIWVKNLDEMQEKAKVTDAEKILILKYLTSHPG